MLIFKLDGAAVSEGGMKPSGIVDVIDEVGHIGDDVRERFVVTDIDSFDLQGLHEALGFRVVIRISAPAHGAAQSMRHEDIPISLGGVLGASVEWWMHPAGGRRLSIADWSAAWSIVCP